MRIEANSVNEYLEKVPQDKKEYFETLRKTVVENLPVGFKECLGYGMIAYVVPHELYPNGYHCSTDLPLPFINLASQKNFIAFYHMGIYANPELMTWFTNEYPKHCSTKLDMGKSCIRFKKADQIPLKLIGELVQKISVKDWISLYESQIKKQ